MNFFIDPTTQYPQELTTCPGQNPVMSILEAIFDPTGTPVTALADCVLISLDTEYNSETRQIAQLGLASLDTRDIYMAVDNDSAATSLHARMVLFRKQQRNKGQYLYGIPEIHYGGNLEAILRDIFTTPAARSGQSRNIVLIGHGIKNDIYEIKRSCGFDIMALPEIKAIVDTSPLIYRIFKTPHRYHTLRAACTLLGMYRRNIHTAGNDAMYTLKALLLIFCRYKDEKAFWDCSDKSQEQLLLEAWHLEAIRMLGRCNNGFDRFAKQRKRSKQEAAPRQVRDKLQPHDMLGDDVNEEDIMGELFRLGV